MAGARIPGISDAQAAGGISNDEPGAERLAIFVSWSAEERGRRAGRCEASVAKPAVADGADAGGGGAIAGADDGAGTSDGGGDVWLRAAGHGVRAAEDQGCGFRKPIHRGACGEGGQGPPGVAAEEDRSDVEGADRGGTGEVDEGPGTGSGGSVPA